MYLKFLQNIYVNVYLDRQTNLSTLTVNLQFNLITYLSLSVVKWNAGMYSFHHWQCYGKLNYQKNPLFFAAAATPSLPGKKLYTEIETKYRSSLTIFWLTFFGNAIWVSSYIGCAYKSMYTRFIVYDHIISLFSIDFIPCLPFIASSSSSSTLHCTRPPICLHKQQKNVADSFFWGVGVINAKFNESSK